MSLFRFFARRRAIQARQAALAEYDDACRRRDTRAIHATQKRLQSATLDCMRCGA